jgi:hypothetical protein
MLLLAYTGHSDVNVWIGSFFIVIQSTLLRARGGLAAGIAIVMLATSCAFKSASR